MRNRFTVWSKLIGWFGVVGAVANLVGALGLFWSSRVIANPAQSSGAEIALLLAVDLLVLVGTVSLIIYMISVIMFGVRAAQYLRQRGAALRGKPWQFVLSWFVPIMNLVVPAFWLREIAGIVAGANAKERKSQVTWFWVTWVLVNAFIGVGVQQPKSQNDFATMAADVVAVASVLAFAIVPLMLGRAAFRELNRDLENFTA